MVNKNSKLVDIGKPNLYRETFPYTEFPAVIFDDHRIDYDFPEQICFLWL